MPQKTPCVFLTRFEHSEPSLTELVGYRMIVIRAASAIVLRRGHDYLLSLAPSTNLATEKNRWVLSGFSLNLRVVGLLLVCCLLVGLYCARSHPRFELTDLLHPPPDPPRDPEKPFKIYTKDFGRLSQ